MKEEPNQLLLSERLEFVRQASDLSEYKVEALKELLLVERNGKKASKIITKTVNSPVRKKAPKRTEIGRKTEGVKRAKSGKKTEPATKKTSAGSKVKDVKNVTKRTKKKSAR